VRAIVFAPHPDDDALGCGGTIAQRVRVGSSLRIVYVTDGSRSHVGSRTHSPDRLRDVREREATAGAAALGVPASELRFLREPDARLPHDAVGLARLATRFAAELDAFAATVAYGPSPRDVHGDHVATARALRAALRTCPDVELVEYAVWCADYPSPSARIVITALTAHDLTAKAAAVAAHRSQHGTVIDDAEQAFILPADVLARAARPVERFEVIAVAER